MKMQLKNSLVVTHIVPGDRSISSVVVQIWKYRDLFYAFGWRDLKVRYKQTLLGIAWVVLQPLMTMVVFTYFFGKVAKIPSNALPYSVFVLIGLVFWNLFLSTLSQSSNSLIDNEQIIKKAYFPRVILPLSVIITTTADFIVNLIVLIIFSALLGYYPSLLTLLYLPPAYLLTVTCALGLGLFTSAFNVKYRDVRYVLPFFFQMMLFLTPIIYPINIVSSSNQLILSINPLTTAIGLIRYSFGESVNVPLNIVILSCVSCVGVLILGIWYFMKTEKLFADLA